MFESEQHTLESQIQVYCAQNGLPDPGVLQWSPIPFAGEWGISTSFFQLAALEARQGGPRSGPRIPVPQRAQQIAEKIATALGVPPGFSHVEAVRGYLNLYFSNDEYAARVVDEVLAAGTRFGCGASKGAGVMVEFSQPNTHKAFHVGHLRSAILGDALSRILECAGYDVVRANYPGDIGLHVIKWLWNYLTYHAGERPTRDITRWMGDIYAEANRRLEENPQFEGEVRALYTRWDHRDPEVVAAWQETRGWSLEGFEEIYNILDIPFDRYYFNSQMEEPGKQVVEELISRGIAEDERPSGPVIVRIDDLLELKKEQYRVLVVLRSDNTAHYSTEDLALAIQKFSDYPDMRRSIYVVDVRQSLHFQQVFKTLEIAGYPWADRCLHLPYELVNLPGNVVMASREGTVVLLEDLMREATQRALQVVQEKNPELDEEIKQKVASAVGLGALRYTMLARDNTKTVTFDWETALDFEGQAAPYIQYAHVRANSILRRMECPLPGSLRPTYKLHPTEVELIDRITRLPGEIQRAAAEYKPLYLTTIAYDLARVFTDFYNQCPVLKAGPEVRLFRLRLVAAARQALANALRPLGITAPEVM
jgi:arginyl-tRNA synthetase